MAVDHQIIRPSDQHRRWAVLTCRWPSLCWTAPPAGPWPLKASCFPTTCCLMGMVRDGKGWYMAIQGSTPDNHHLLNFYIGPLIFERFLCSFGGGFRWWTTCGGLYWNAVPDDRIRCAKTDWLVETGRCLCQSLAERDHSGFYIPKWFDQSKQMQDMDFTKETEMDLINDDPQNWCFDFWLTSRQVCDAQWHSHWCLCSSIAMHPMHCLVTFNHPEQLEYWMRNSMQTNNVWRLLDLRPFCCECLSTKTMGK